MRKNIKIKFRLSDKEECLRIKFKEQIHMRVRWVGHKEKINKNKHFYEAIKTKSWTKRKLVAEMGEIENRSQWTI